MRLAITWLQVGLAGLTLLAACAPGDRSAAPNEPLSSHPIAQPAAPMNPGTVLLQESFADTAFAARGWYDNTRMATTAVEHAAGSTRALEVHFLAGATTPTWGGAARHLFPATSTLDVSYWVKYSPNWVGSGKPYHPHEFLVLSDQDGDYDSPASNWLTAYIEQNYQGGGVPRLALQDSKAINTSFGAPPINLIGLTENRSTSGCNGIVESAMLSECLNLPPWNNDKQLSATGVAFQPSPGPGYKGDWNQVEVYLQLNSVVGGIGQPDGVMQYWFNGTLVIDRHDILFRTGARPALQFHQFLIAPYIGDGSPVDQSMWVDNLTVATGRIAGVSSDLVAPVAPVASIGVSPSGASVAVGSTAQFTATLQDASGNVVTGAAVTWASSNPAVATISGSGLATAIAAGVTTISATSGAIVGTATLSVPTPVATVTVAPATVSQGAGATQQLVATLKDATGNVLIGRAVAWTSSAPAVATVNASGLETGVGAGAATLTATSEGRSGTAAIAVAVTKPGTVTGLSVAAVTSTAVTLSFTEVNDGTGQPGSYDIRSTVGTMSWGPAVSVSQGTCQAPMAGSAIGAVRTCTVQGLTPSTSYQFQLVAFRGTLNVSAVFGALSNVASGTTAGTAVAPVASVTVSPASASFPIGATQQLTATLKDSGGNVLTGRSVVWTSSSPTVATVSASGLVTGIVAGTATINATSNGIIGTSTVTVTNMPVASVTLSPTSASVIVGGTQQFAATLKDAGGNMLSGRIVTWASSSPTVATVSGSGLATGVAAGTATVTATSEGRSGTATVTVTTVPVASVTLSPTSAGVIVGGKQQFAVTLKDASGNILSGRIVTWASNSPTVATVGSGGLVTGVLAGTATITATSEGQSGMATVTVTTVPVASVALSPTSASVIVGGTQQFAATLKDANGNILSGRIVSWGSSSPTVATVSGTGLATGVVAGTTTVTATSEGQSGTATVTVTATATKPGSVANLTVTSATNNSVTLSFTEVNDGTGQPARYDVRWAIGTMSWGAAAGVTQGSCLVPMAGTVIGATRTCTVLGLAASTSYQFQLIAFRGTLDVNAVFGALSNVASGTTTAVPPVPVASVGVSPTSESVAVGQTAQLTATPRDASGNALVGRIVMWASSSPATATVSGNGLVTGVAAGAATITATSEGKSGSSAATVTPAPPPAPVATVSVSPAAVGVTVRLTVQLTATERDASGNVLAGRVVTWGSSNTGVATVNGSGLVTGVAVGTVTITATSEGKSGSATITVGTAPSSDEPVFAPGTDAVLWSDNFDSYSSVGAMASGTVPNYTSAGNVLVSPGRNGTGKALRSDYSLAPTNQDGGQLQRSINWLSPWKVSTGLSSVAPTTKIVVQFWFRFSAGGSPAGGGTKWVEHWYATGRWQPGIDGPTGGGWNPYVLPLPTKAGGMVWTFNNSGDPTDNNGHVEQAQQPVGPWIGDVNDGQWHRWTAVLQASSSPRAGDGMFRAWIDGTKIMDLSASAVGVTPPGGLKPWCYPGETATIPAQAMQYLQLPGVANNINGALYTLDHDDLVIWKQGN